ncbi:MAG: hypothetical protein LUE86_10580 [Clostridiales bacterium]|nr:hypothetical protein [Clostridiales bacterium]
MSPNETNLPTQDPEKQKISEQDISAQNTKETEEQTTTDTPESEAVKPNTTEQETAKTSNTKLNQKNKKTTKINFGKIVPVILLIIGALGTLTLIVCPFFAMNICAELVILEIYLICYFFFLCYMILSEFGITHQLVWCRRDLWGLLLWTVSISVILPCVVAYFNSDNEESNDVIIWIIVLLTITTVIWFGIHAALTQNKPAARQELLTTAHRMATLITLIGISQTELPDENLKILFGVMGITYTVMPDMLNFLARLIEPRLIKLSEFLRHELQTNENESTSCTTEASCKSQQAPHHQRDDNHSIADDTSNPSVVVNLTVSPSIEIHADGKVLTKSNKS